jgi:hypothetical protein
MKTFGTLVDYMEGLFATIIFRIIFGFALFYFLINVYRFIKDAGNAEKRKDHQKAIAWSIVALAAMFSVWALVSIVTGTFGVRTGIPQINQQYLNDYAPRQ